MTADQAFAGLVACIGGGGISSVMVGLFAYLTEARKGRKPSDGTVAITLGDNLGMRGQIEEANIHLMSIATSLIRRNAILEIEAEERFDGKDFADRLDNKELRLMRDNLRDNMRRSDKKD